MGTLELASHARESEPGGDFLPVGQPVTQVGARQIERPLALQNLVDRRIRVRLFDEHHQLERHHGDAEFFLVLAQQVLGVIRTVERLPMRIAAGTGVVTPHDEMGAPVVFSDDRVPDRFTRSAHPHRQRQQRQHGGVSGILRQQRLVAAYARVVVDVTRLGHTDHRVNE